MFPKFPVPRVHVARNDEDTAIVHQNPCRPGARGIEKLELDGLAIKKEAPVRLRPYMELTRPERTRRDDLEWPAEGTVGEPRHDHDRTHDSP